MSYPAWFDPTDWDETKHEAFKAEIMSGCDEESPEVQAVWSSIADKLIEIADLFKTAVNTGIVQVMMQTDNEASENEMYLKFRVYQRTYGQVE